MAFFVGFLVRTELSAWHGPEPFTLQVKGTLYATLSSDLQRDRRHLRQFGLKFGLRIGSAQKVQELAVGGRRLKEQTPVSNDLQAVFGGPPSDRWAGFVTGKPVTPKYAAANVVQFPVSLRLTDVRQVPQLVPVVVRYDNRMSFAASFLHGLWYLPPPPAKVS